MRNSRSFSFALALMMAGSFMMPAFSSAQNAPTMNDAIAAIDAYAPRALAEQGAPGMSVAITDGSRTIKILTYGYADVAAKAPVTADTRFAVGSISKSMTTLALLQLHDAGKIDLDAPVTRYLPSWNLPGGDAIVVHQLLSHTAGVPDDYALFNSAGFDLATLQHAHTIFAPGTSWSYSNDGFETVGAIESAVSEQSWPNLIASTVFAPIGMAHSSPYFSPALMSDVAIGYTIRDADLPTPPHPALMPTQPMDFVAPAGSVLSTPEDMAQYMRFYLNGGKTASGRQLIAPATFAAMTTPDHLGNGHVAGSPGTEMAEWPDFYKQYGFGLSIFNTNGDHLIGHTGGISGYTACMQMNLTQNFGVIAMSNLVEAPLHPCAIVRYAMAVLRAQKLGKPLPAAPAPPADAGSVANADDYAGAYAMHGGPTVTVTANGAHLALVDAGTTYQLVPNGSRGVFWTDDPRFATFYIAFRRDAKKTVDSFTNGPALYTTSAYAGPQSFPHPSSYDALVGRYENSFWGQPSVARIVIVNGALTLDGLTPLKPKADGSFSLGSARVRFDTPFEGKMQRMWVDGVDAYRVDLP